MKKVPAPPKQRAPISEEQMAIVKKKVSAPTGPRPAALQSFKAPKKLSNKENKPKIKSKYSDEEDDFSDEESHRSEDDTDSYNSDQDSRKNKSKTKSRTSKANRRRDISDDEEDGNKNRRRFSSDIQYSEDDENNGRRKISTRTNRTPTRRKYDDYDSDDIENEDRGSKNVPGNKKNKQNKKTKEGKSVVGLGKNAQHAPNKRSQDSRQEEGPLVLRDDERLEGPDEESEMATYDDAYGYGKGKITSQFSGMNPMNSGGQQTPTGMKAGIFNFKPILHSTYRELRAFVLTSPPPGLIVRCYVEREKSLAPFYSLCADLEDGTGRELVVCKKVLRSFTSHYVFSLKAEDLYRKREQRSRLYLGKLRAHGNNDYILYDNGVLDKPAGSEANEDDHDYDHHTLGHSDEDGNNDHETESKTGRGDGDSSLYRQQMAVIHFNSKTRPVHENLRGMEVCVPLPHQPHRLSGNNNNNNSDLSPGGNNGHNAQAVAKAPNLEQPFQQIRDSGRQNDLMANKYFVLHEKNSKYDPLSSCLVDFKGRANIASVKNFQLVESTPETGIGSTISARVRGASQDDSRDVILLQMGKATDQCFNLDFRAPLTMLQAFAIAVARFDAKLKNA